MLIIDLRYGLGWEKNPSLGPIQAEKTKAAMYDSVALYYHPLGVSGLSRDLNESIHLETELKRIKSEWRKLRQQGKKLEAVVIYNLGWTIVAAN